MAGFRPIGHLTGGAGGSFKTRRFQKGTTGTEASRIFPGDLVTLKDTGTIRAITASISGNATVEERNVIGVAARVYENRQGKPKTFATSGKSVYSASADGDWWDVYVDPNIVYEAQLQAGVSAEMTDIGRLLGATAAATVVTAVGQGGMQVMTSAPATVNAALVRIIGISSRSLTPSDSKASSDGFVEVVILSPMFGPTGQTV